MCSSGGPSQGDSKHSVPRITKDLENMCTQNLFVDSERVFHEFRVGVAKKLITTAAMLSGRFHLFPV